METKDIIKLLINIRRKIMKRMVEETKYQKSLVEKYGDNVYTSSYEKSVGVWVGCSTAEIEIYKLIQKLKQEK
ncbi:hypothetical protein C4577_05035 [Candidatus Parcubacteria bacterium]|nr:MAG: hypothetical protein C4577_05035 [Candidatus Parcubacteria bacterium]